MERREMLTARSAGAIGVAAAPPKAGATACGVRPHGERCGPMVRDGPAAIVVFICLSDVVGSVFCVGKK